MKIHANLVGLTLTALVVSVFSFGIYSLATRYHKEMAIAHAYMDNFEVKVKEKTGKFPYQEKTSIRGLSLEERVVYRKTGYLVIEEDRRERSTGEPKRFLLEVTKKYYKREEPQIVTK